MKQHFSHFSMKKIIIATCIAMSLPLAAQAGTDEGKPSGHCDRGSEMHGEKHREMGERGIPPHLKQLNLSQTQQDQIFKIMHDAVPAIRDQHIARKNIHDELYNLAQAERFDDAKAQQLADQLAKLEKDGTLNRARTEAKIFALLTPEQRQKARTIESERDSQHKDEPRKGDRLGLNNDVQSHMQAADLKNDAANKSDSGRSSTKRVFV